MRTFCTALGAAVLMGSFASGSVSHADSLTVLYTFQGGKPRCA